MSISASSVTLAAWSSSSVKSDAGGSGSGCSALAVLSAAALESLSTVKAEHTRVFRGFRSGWSTR